MHHPIIQSIASALLLYLAWPPSSVNTLLPIAYVPVFIAVYNQPSAKDAFKVFYVSFMCFLLLVHWPLFIEGFRLGALIFGLFIVPVFWSVPVTISFWISKKKGLETGLIILPFLFVSQEVVQYYWDFSFTWVNLGLGFSDSVWLMGAYKLIGPEGGAFLIISCNCSLFYVYSRLKDKKNIGFIHCTPVLMVLFLLLFPNFFRQDSNGKAVRVAIFQPTTAQYSEMKDNLKKQTEFFANSISVLPPNSVDLIVGPESYFLEMKKSPLFVNNLNKHPAIERLKELSAFHNAPILSGAILVHLLRGNETPTASAKFRKPGQYYDIYNGSIFITPHGNVEWRTKQSLLPFAEKTPFYRVFNYLNSKGFWPYRFDDTYGTVPFDGTYNFEGLRISAPICYEGVFPNVVSEYLDTSANLLVVLSNDWSGSENMLEMQRSYTNVLYNSFGKPVILAAMNGGSSVSANDVIPNISEEPLEVVEVALNNDLTVYSKIAGLQFCWLILSLVVIIAILILARLHKINF